MLDVARRRLIVLDVDGTLLTSDKSILPSTRQSVKALVARGHCVALASARPPRSVQALSYDLIGSDAPELVALNGAFVTRGRTTLLERTIAASSATVIIRAVREQGLETNLFAAWDWLVDAMSWRVQAEAATVGFAPTRVADLAARQEPAHKLLLIGAPENTARFRDCVNASDLGVLATLSKPTYCEVTAAGVSKAEAIGFIAAALAIGQAATIAFGDGENDLMMIKRAGIGVAMGNGVATLKRTADHVTASNDEHGIASALAHLGLVDPISI